MFVSHSFFLSDILQEVQQRFELMDALESQLVFSTALATLLLAQIHGLKGLLSQLWKGHC